MSPATAVESARAPDPAAVERARRLFADAEKQETQLDRGRYGVALRSALAYVEEHRRALEPIADEVATHLDEMALAFYRLSETDLAARAVETGLAFAPGSATLLHRKALILLAQNRSVDQVLPLVDQSLEANPHDKTVWATKGDALRLLNRPAEAAEAYLRAQALDATSMQYVEKALRVDPKNSKALRTKLDLARAHGGDEPALDAADALLVTHPDDPDLLLARAELLGALGRGPESLDALTKATEARPNDPHVGVLAGRQMLKLGRAEDGLARLRAVLGGPTNPDASTLADLAEAAEGVPDGVALALDARGRLRGLEPRNVSNLQSLRALAEKTGQHDLAAETSRAILEVSPENLEAMRTVADLALRAGRLDEGFDAYRALLKAHPQEIVEHRRALDAAQEHGRPEIAVEFARGLLAEVPDDREALDVLARAYSDAQEWPRALQALDGLLKLDPTSVPLLLEKKRLLGEAHETAGLDQVLDELFRLDPTRYDLALERGHHYLGVAYDRPEGTSEREAAARTALVAYERSSVDPALAGASLLGIARASRLVRDAGRAITSYRQFLDGPGQGRRADVMKELGHVLREGGRLTEAEAQYSASVALGLEDADLFWGEAEVLAALNQDAKALRFVELLLEREPSNPLYLRRKGQLLLKAGKRAEALEVLKSAVAGAHGDPKAQFEVGDALRARGHYTDAVEYYRAGLALDPTSRAGRLALAETLHLAGRSNEVVPLLDGLLREDPNDLAAWKARADATRSLQRTADLQYSLKAILLLEPHNPSALREKARLHLDAGEKNDAYESLAQLVDQSGAELKDPTVHLQLGDLAAELGRVEEANRAYERAAQLDPTQTSEIAVRRGRLRLAAGRPDLALEVLDSTLSQLPAGSRKSTTALLLRAEILTALERAPEAQQVLEEVRTLDPTSPVATAGIARALLDQGKPGEAKSFLETAMPAAPPQATLVLLLAEAQAGLGGLPDAVATVRSGLEALPKSAPLWVRLGELGVATDAWPDAATAYAHALALDAQNPELHLKAGFVAEKMGHPNEALALYDRATELAPGSKHAWTSRGIALLATGRPEEAQASFERALGIDSDFDAAKDGKKTAQQRTREALVDKHGRDALLLESRLQRPVTKNDLFVTLHVPFDLLEPVLAALQRDPGVRLDRLSEAEVHDLETSSYQLIATALDRRPEGIERRGFALSDVAALSPPTATLAQIQREFGYLKAVLEADLRPENLRLTPDVEELARRALALPPADRTLFKLVQNLKVGIFRARIIKVVEATGSASHTPGPALDLGAYTPEFRAAGDAAPVEEFFAPENRPAPATAPGGPAAAGPIPHAKASSADPRHARCVGCGGIASIVHDCGAPICPHCVAEFRTCPKCARPVDAASSRPIGAGTAAHHHQASAPAPHPSPLRSILTRKPAAGKPATKPAAPKAEAPHAPAPPAPEPPAAAPPPKPVRRERTDDEPRL